jgi:hypothetical protein
MPTGCDQYANGEHSRHGEVCKGPDPLKNRLCQVVVESGSHATYHAAYHNRHAQKPLHPLVHFNLPGDSIPLPAITLQICKSVLALAKFPSIYFSRSRTRFSIRKRYCY